MILFSLQIDQIYIYLNDRREKKRTKFTDIMMKLDIDSKVKKKNKVRNIDLQQQLLLRKMNYWLGLKPWVCKQKDVWEENVNRVMYTNWDRRNVMEKDFRMNR